MKYFKFIVLFSAVLLQSCESSNSPVEQGSLKWMVSEFTPDSSQVQGDEVLYFETDVPQPGRYQITIALQGNGEVWVEDYVDNPDDRTYNITGNLSTQESDSLTVFGSPLNAGLHKMAIHAKGQGLEVLSISFECILKHTFSQDTLIQSMDGNAWKLSWSEEFEKDGLPDTSKWTYDIGDWGWGNNELQTYTAQDLNTARIENGALIIKANKIDSSSAWTSSRLTTRGKTAFTYGRIEFRAKVPSTRGTWAAGWLLGNAYVDELSWPYCGEIDVLECVGFEINDSTGTGLNHATCHTRKYYFKQGNQIGSEIVVHNMETEFHTYAIEWYPTEIKAFLDGVHYYTYDKNQDELEWPFHEAQNLVLNLAVGGGWGGQKGIDSQMTSAQYIIDYVRVYEKVDE